MGGHILGDMSCGYGVCAAFGFVARLGDAEPPHEQKGQEVDMAKIAKILTLSGTKRHQALH